MAKVPEYEDRLSKFERMCVVKTFREDRTLVAASEYVADALGQKFVESVPLNMERAWAESHKRCPLICLLSRGSDPTKLIEDLAKRKKIKVPYQCMADSLTGHTVSPQDSPHAGLRHRPLYLRLPVPSPHRCLLHVCVVIHSAW